MRESLEVEEKTVKNQPLPRFDDTELKPNLLRYSNKMGVLGRGTQSRVSRPDHVGGSATAQARPTWRDQARQGRTGAGPAVPDRTASRCGARVWTSGTSASRGARPATGRAAPSRRAGAAISAASAAARASSASHSRISICRMAQKNSAMKLAQVASAPSTGRVSSTRAASLAASGAKERADSINQDNRPISSKVATSFSRAGVIWGRIIASGHIYWMRLSRLHPITNRASQSGTAHSSAFQPIHMSAYQRYLRTP